MAARTSLLLIAVMEVSGVLACARRGPARRAQLSRRRGSDSRPQVPGVPQRQEGRRRSGHHHLRTIAPGRHSGGRPDHRARRSGFELLDRIGPRRRGPGHAAETASPQGPRDRHARTMGRAGRALRWSFAGDNPHRFARRSAQGLARGSGQDQTARGGQRPGHGPRGKVAGGGDGRQDRLVRPEHEQTRVGIDRPSGPDHGRRVLARRHRS